MMNRQQPQRSDEPSRAYIALLSGSIILGLSLLLALVGAILLGTGTTSGGFSLAVGLAMALVAMLSIFGRQGHGFLGVAAATLGAFSAASMLFLDYTWPAFFLTLVSGVMMFLIGAFLLGETSDLHIGLDAHE
jgi:hypothetical protein